MEYIAIFIIILLVLQYSMIVGGFYVIPYIKSLFTPKNDLRVKRKPLHQRKKTK